MALCRPLIRRTDSYTHVRAQVWPADRGSPTALLFPDSPMKDFARGKIRHQCVAKGFDAVGSDPPVSLSPGPGGLVQTWARVHITLAVLQCMYYCDCTVVGGWEQTAHLRHARCVALLCCAQRVQCHVPQHCHWPMYWQAGGCRRSARDAAAHPHAVSACGSPLP